MSDRPLRTWAAGTVAPADATATELALHMALYGCVFVERQDDSPRCEAFAEENGLIVDCILPAGHDEPHDPGPLDWTMAPRDALGRPTVQPANGPEVMP